MAGKRGIDPRLKTETVVYERVEETQSKAGGVVETIAQTIGPRLVSVRPLSRSNQLPSVENGVTLPIATHSVRDDVAVEWTDPRTNLARRGLDGSWRIRWTPSDGSGERVLMPTTNSKWGTHVGQWVTECVEVL